MTTGAVAGAVLGLLSWLIVSALHPAGLADFFTSTGSWLAWWSCGPVVQLIRRLTCH